MMTLGTGLKSEKVPIANSSDVVMVRQRVRAWTIELKFSLVDQTKIVTAASELGRNTLEYGGGGALELTLVENAGRKGIRMTFTDQGPGIPDLDLALRDGYTSGSGLGLGLGGSKRLMHEFEVDSKAGIGTTITAIRWK
jgi:serine/threonine-protein kinase RsbT